MGYYVRLLSPSERRIPFNELKEVVDTIRLVAGSDADWDELQISGPVEIPIAHLERLPVTSHAGAKTIEKLRTDIAVQTPASAREWLKNYLSKVKTIYAFQLLTDNLTTDLEWRTLGHIQNHLKDNLGGVIQSDNEGFYNEEGDYVLWQMYNGAGGSVPAATLDENGEWLPFQLKLADVKAVERFKRGDKPQKGFFDLFMGKR